MNYHTLNNESDVEQHVILPLLVRQPPFGLGFPPEAIKTKLDIRRLTIGKGKDQKLYYPDYALLASALPSIIIEAKAPGEDLEEGLREARLYAHEVNATYGNVNPVTHIIACNDRELILTTWDSKIPILTFNPSEATSIDQVFADLLDYCSYDRCVERASTLSAGLNKQGFTHPLSLIGGTMRSQEELPPNQFGTAIALDYRGLFNPVTRDERSTVAKEAYVPSSRRDRYVEPIDRIIRAALPPSQTQATTIADQNNPVELISVLKKGKQLDHQVVLLIGGVGVGKSTFVDYLRDVKLPRDLRRGTIWLSVDMNNAPVSQDHVYNWVLDHIVLGLKENSDLDFDDLDVIRKLFSKELNSFRKGPSKLLGENSPEYNARLVDYLMALLADKLNYTKALARYICGNANKSCIIILDNCDKRVRDEQLLMFEVAQWLQSEFVMLVILPLRDETFDNHRNQPPLDTAIKDLVFRIEPPMFQEVLKRRIGLALRHIDESKQFEFSLSNGMRVTYTGRDQAAYLEAILKSVHDHDRFVRRLITGLAGRNLRKALELFLDFCKSGHIPDEVIFKTKTMDGQFILPFEMVTRVLLRGSQRYYRGDESHLKNLLAINEHDNIPNYFVRFAILKWLEFHLSVRGPSNLEGYHQVVSLISDLTLAGYDEAVVWRDLYFLLRADCIIAEHLGTEHLDREDLIKLSPAGWVHLDMLNTVDYYSAVAEDTLYGEPSVAEDVARRIQGLGHYSPSSMLENAETLIGYLQDWQGSGAQGSKPFLEDQRVEFLRRPKEILDSARNSINLFRTEHAWDLAASQIELHSVHEGMVTKIISVGFLVWLNDVLSGLVHYDNMPDIVWSEREQYDGAIIKVRVYFVNKETQRIGLRFVSLVMR